MSNINKIKKVVMQQLDAAAEEEYKVTNKDVPEAPMPERQKQMSEQDYHDMYQNDYINPGIKMKEVQCTQCLRTFACAESSQMAYYKICKNCRNKSAQREVIEL